MNWYFKISCSVVLLGVGLLTTRGHDGLLNIFWDQPPPRPPSGTLEAHLLRILGILCAGCSVSHTL